MKHVESGDYKQNSDFDLSWELSDLNHVLNKELMPQDDVIKLWKITYKDWQIAKVQCTYTWKMWISLGEFKELTGIKLAEKEFTRYKANRDESDLPPYISKESLNFYVTNELSWRTDINNDWENDFYAFRTTNGKNYYAHNLKTPYSSDDYKRLPSGTQISFTVRIEN